MITDGEELYLFPVPPGRAVSGPRYPYGAGLRSETVPGPADGSEARSTAGRPGLSDQECSRT